MGCRNSNANASTEGLGSWSRQKWDWSGPASPRQESDEPRSPLFAKVQNWKLISRQASNSSDKPKPIEARTIASNPGLLLEDYEMDEASLGEGRFGTVHRGENKQILSPRTGARTTVAIKSIPITRIEDVDAISREIDVMSKICHSAIIKLHESFQDASNVFLVLELCEGGTLLQRVREVGHFTEVHTARILFQILPALRHLHDNHICHRDIKPDNVLFMEWHPVEQGFVKLIDFGGATFFRNGEYLTSKVGTPTYVAPEVLQGKYNETCDLWSTGITIFVVLSGIPPFRGDDDDILKQAQLGNISLNTPHWSTVSEDAKDLVRELCKMRGNDRISAEDAIDHKFIFTHRKMGSLSAAF